MLELNQTNNWRGGTLVVFLLLFSISIFAQNPIQLSGIPIASTYEDELNALFKKSHVFQIDANLLASQSHIDDELLIQLQLGNEFDWEILMYENELLPQRYSRTELSESDILITSNSSLKTYTGFLQNNKHGQVRLTINNDFIFGEIHNGDQSYFIEPLNGVVPNAPQGQYVVYNTADVIEDTNALCGVTATKKYEKSVINNNVIGTEKAHDCAEVEVALAADNSMFNKYGSVAATENYMIGIWNAMAPDFTGWFSKDLEFIIVTTFVVTGTDPWIPGTDATDLLTDFGQWGNGGNFIVQFDIAQLWTDRNIIEPNSNPVGIAYVGVVCSNAAYSLIEDFSGSGSLMRQTSSHEVGHNFDALHDAAGSGFIMAPAVTGTSTWSNASITDISNHIDSRNCLEECLHCLAVVSAEVQNCSDGFYELEVCIRHTDRGPLSTLQIAIENGPTNTYSFNSTGQQCETISGLAASATTNILVTVNDTASNDTECLKTINYDSPHPDCVCTPIFAEDFDTEILPPGWTNNALGTNQNARWEFANATYGVNTPAGGLNGSGMAFWDDDAKDDTGAGTYDNNGSDHMELITPAIDITQYTYVTLDFDYNFWTYDGADAFKVDVWDGASWINILNSNVTDCGAWGCTYPHFRQVVDTYNNANFQVRFTYDDSADSWQWHIGIDNVEICGYNLAPLPLDLTSFDATEEECQVTLNWSIANEETNETYEIEKSLDGIQFETIGNVNALLSNRSYQFVDSQPAYENFYRLKTTSETGAINYSTIKNIKATSCKEGALDILEIFPNPTKGDLFYNIHSNDETDVTVEIRNAAGMLVDKITIKLISGMNNQSFDTDHLAKGMYYIQVMSDYGSSTVKKFVKN